MPMISVKRAITKLMTPKLRILTLTRWHEIGEARRLPRLTGLYANTLPS